MRVYCLGHHWSKIGPRHASPAGLVVAPIGSRGKHPELLGPFVGTFEIACGSLVLLGLLTRLAVIPLLTIMAVGLITTKWPLLANQGFWAAAHEARTDWSMFLGALFLLIVGAGPWSLDARLESRP